MIRSVKPLALAIPASMAISPWASLVLAALWLLPDWFQKWIDVRDRWHR